MSVNTLVVKIIAQNVSVTVNVDLLTLIATGKEISNGCGPVAQFVIVESLSEQLAADALVLQSLGRKTLPADDSPGDRHSLAAMGFLTLGNQFDGNTTGRIIRHEKTAMYTTPVFSGFKATVEYAAANDNSTSTVANNTNGYTGFSLQYNVGPLNAIYSYSNEKAGSNPAAGATSAIGTAPAAVLAANTDVTWNMLAANYKFGNATIMGGYTTTKHNGAAVAAEDSKSWNIAGKYMVTPEIELLANYLVRDTQLTTAADAKLLGLGVNYYLNTATNLYVRYEGIKFDAFGSTAEQTQNVWAAGIRFQF